MEKFYPVISLLRRSSMSHSYCLSPNLEVSEVCYCFKSDLSWHKTKQIEFLELRSKSVDPMQAAADICAAENEIYEKASLHGQAYSLLFGPCDPHISRVCVLRGLWRSDSKKTISAPS